MWVGGWPRQPKHLTDWNTAATIAPPSGVAPRLEF
jgi:hypothetical protein